MKNKLKWARIMKLIRDVEEKYGRISKVPTTDKEWQEIQELCCSEDDKNINLSSKVQKKIAKKVDEGRSISYVANQFKISPYKVTQIIQVFNIQQKPMFYYSVSKNGKPTYFFRSKTKAIPIIFHRKFGNRNIAETYLNNSGYQLKANNFIWKNIPIGSYYMAGHDKFIKKTSEEYIEAKDD